VNLPEATLLVDKLEALRHQLAELESAHHREKVTAFMVNRETSRTVKDAEFAADAAALSYHRDILMLRAEIRTLEDRLRIAIHADEA
jgi:hypothetical protein